MLEAMLESTAVESMAESVVESMRESMAKATMEAMLESTAVESKSESELEDADEGGEIKCGCREVRVAMGILDSMRGLQKKDLKGRVEVVSSIGEEEWRRICHRHVRAIASCWELKTSGVKREQLIKCVMKVQRKGESLGELRTDEWTYRWFRMEGRPVREDDGLGMFKYVGMRSDEFRLDRTVVWERY